MNEISCLAIFVFGLGACTAAETFAPSPAGPFEATLAVISNVLEDAELNTTVRSSSSLTCKREIACVNALYLMVDTYTECSSLPGITTLSGKSTFSLGSLSVCNSYAGGNIPSSSFTASKTFENFVRVSSNGTTTVTVPNPIGVLFSSNQWRITFTDLSRVTAGDINRNYTLTTTDDVISTGTRAAGTRIIDSGEVRIADTTKNVTHLIAMANLAYETPSCCYPTSGTITNDLSSGAVTTRQTLEFTDTACGAATYDDGSGTSSAITLRYGCE